MNIKLNTSRKARQQLNKNGFYRIEKIRPGMAVSCEKGLLWVTQSGDRRDYILTPGQNLVVKNNGRILIEALRDVEFEIVSQEKARLN